MNSDSRGRTDYSFANEWQKARERLAALEALLDPTSTDHLDRLGVARGWICLEVGAGSGSIADWLCRRVGLSGRVVATDLDTRFVATLEHPNLEVRIHDIGKDSLEEGQFDLVHCRLVLEHVEDKERALRKMGKAVKPGGWLLIEENDDSTFLADPLADNRSRDVFRRTVDALHTAMESQGYDRVFGTKVHGMLCKLGFDDVGSEGRAKTTHGGSKQAGLALLSYEKMRESMLATGKVTADDIDAANALWQDPDFSWRQFMSVATWAHRPLGD